MRRFLRNPFAKVAAPPGDAPAPRTDKLGPFALATHHEALPERQIRSVARILAFVALSSIMLNISLAWGLLTILPLKEVMPLFVTFSDKSNQIVHVEPFEKTERGFKAMTEVLVRNYVAERHSVVADDPEMQRRWGPAGAMWRNSTEEESRRFMEATRPTWENLKQRRVGRIVEISSASEISLGFWQVEFVLVEVENNVQISRKSYVASLRIDYLPQNVKDTDRLLNPLGFKVQTYTVVERKLTS